MKEKRFIKQKTNVWRENKQNRKYYLKRMIKLVEPFVCYHELSIWREKNGASLKFSRYWKNNKGYSE